MTIPGNATSLLLRSAAPTAYQISRSVRFNSSDSAYLSRTPASAGNRKTWTWAGWVKRVAIGQSYEYLMDAGVADNFGFTTNSAFLYLGSVPLAFKQSTAVFRDASAWMHYLINFDSTNATAEDRCQIWINGVRLTSWSSNPTIPLNTQTLINSTSTHTMCHALGYSFMSAYLADIHFIDGQALDPTSFGEFSATTGVWNPKAYTGSYGTNGFHLEFADNSAATATTLGKDTSGNGNNWTPNNLSVTAGAGNDSVVDVPTNGAQTDTGAGGEVRGNYCTWNPLALGVQATLSNGNLDVAYSSSGSEGTTVATHGVSTGKWYWEVTFTATSTTNPRGIIGITRTSTNVASFPGATADSYSYYPGGEVKYNNNTSGAYGAAAVVNDVIGVALNLDAGEITFYNNGVGQGVAYSSLPAGTYFPAIGDGSGANTFTAACNWGQRSFAYTAPSGFKALNTANLPAPVVTKPSTVFETVIWTGNGNNNRTISTPFSPDLVWAKFRNQAFSHGLFDTVRGADLRLRSNGTNAEDTVYLDFASNGFIVDGSTSYNDLNDTFVGWCWDAGSSTVTNTVGSISSQVRANASAGFSVVTYNHGSGVGASTIGHGLGVAPSLILSKFRDGTANWDVYVRALGPGGRLILNSTAAFSSETDPWNNTNPTSTVFSVGPSSWKGVGNHVAYCFAPVAGYSSFGSYTGNGSADGPFVYTGFRPRWVMIKRTDTTNHWIIQDATRNTYNVVDLKLAANTSNAENDLATVGDTSQNTLDYLSNGFKCRTSNAGTNASGGTFVWAAFAENPFQYARAR